MEKLNRKKVLIYGLIYSTLLFIIPILNLNYIYAGNAKGLAGDAESYRANGYEAQKKGDIDTAIEWYQKAANINPDYAAPHNDLGILFETKGWLDRAESEYQKALAIDPNYKEVYTNLALLYERKGELEKAAFHWMKRYKLGNPEEPWTQEARARLEKLGLLEKTGREAMKAEPGPAREITEKKITSKKEAPGPSPAVKKSEPKAEKKERITKEKKAPGWARLGSSERKRKAPKPKARSKKKAIDKELEESLRLAEERLKRERTEQKDTSPSPKPETRLAPDTGSGVLYSRAKDYYNKGEYSKALDTIRAAKKDYPDNAQLLRLEDDIKDKMKEERIQDHYTEGMIHYRQKDYQGAKKEFEAILSILPE